MRMNNADSFFLFTLVILYYDYLLTFDDERRCIWGRKGSTLWIFYINRYFSVFALIASNIGLFPTARLSSETICSKFETYEQVTIVIAQLITSVTLLLRTFALYTQSRKILAIILSIGLPLIGLIIWSVANQHADSQVTLFIGCLVIGTETQNVQVSILPDCRYLSTEIEWMASGNPVSLGFAWVALIAYEILIFLLTIIKTYRGRNVTYHAAAGHVGGLVELMCRDGAIYFAIMIWFNIANTVTFYIGSVRRYHGFFDPELYLHDGYPVARPARMSIKACEQRFCQSDFTSYHQPQKTIPRGNATSRDPT
ncbi:hypothetical protein C8Q75DRAFT_805027 [Abortiporus biennis]|nr:hypothetical protein C8Q75DRAFT_805027 [Abortiporus biennis]